MFQLLKTFAFILTLSAPALAQWGAVVAQPDTNRFINSTQTYGLVMPHQEVIIGKLDTTISSAGTNGGGGYKVIVGSLLNWDDNCVGGNRWLGRWDCSGSYEAWREKEKSTSWYQASRGDTTKLFPTNYYVKIQVAQDSITVWNRDTGELWMAFATSSDGNISMVGSSSAVLTGIAFKDGILYVTNSANGTTYGQIALINFISDDAHGYEDSGHQKHHAEIHSRNVNDNNFTLLSSTPATASSAINAVAVVRDPFGLTDENGAPKHWWVTVDGAGTASAYNPHTNAIYDASDAGNSGTFGVLSSRGRFLRHSEDGTTDDFRPRNTIFNITADGWDVSGGVFQYDQSGANDFGWTVGVTMSDGATIEGQSIVGYNDDIAIIGSDQGVYNFHFAPNTAGAVTASNGVGARQRLSSTVNAPVEFGDAVLVAAFEDNTTDSSPYGNTMTSTGGGGTVSAVFGNGYSAVAGSYLNRIGDAEFNIGTTDFGVHFWFKMAANPPASAILTTVRDVSEGDLLHVSMATDGTIDAFISDDGGSTSDQVSPSADVADNQWHHFAFVRDSEVVTVYYDGVNVGTDAVDAVTTGMLTDDITIGANVDPGSNGGYADGLQLDDWQLSPTNAIGAEAIAKIHAEGRKQLNRGGSPINRDHLHAADVDYVDALDNGIWLAGNEDSLTVFDGRLALQTFGASGTINDAKLIQNAGTDSIGVIIVTNTETILIQPDVNLEKMASSTLYHKEPILIGETVVVDSAGVGGIFWAVDDAISAGANAGISDVHIGKGHFGGFTQSNNGMLVRGSGGYSGAGANANARGTIIYSTTKDGIDVTGTGNTFRDFTIIVPVGGAGGEYDCVDVDSHDNIFDNLRLGECDDVAFQVNGNWNIFRSNKIYDTDAVAFSVEATFNQYIGNIIVNPGSAGWQNNGSGDNSSVIANVVGNGGGITNHISALDGVFVGNLTDGAMTDNSGTSTVTGNEQY
jgi:hypothetical protein